MHSESIDGPHNATCLEHSIDIAFIHAILDTHSVGESSIPCKTDNATRSNPAMHTALVFTISDNHIKTSMPNNSPYLAFPF